MLDAVDAAAAVSIVGQAHRRGVPVIAYDRFIADADLDYYVSFDSRRIGRLPGRGAGPRAGGRPDRARRPAAGRAHGQRVGDRPELRGARGRASPTRSTARPIEVLAAYDTPDWSPDKAQEWVTGQLTQYAGPGRRRYAANDGTAGGAISAMKAAGLDPVPPVTGQDAELAAIQRIVTGDQSMTVYKAISEQARTAAELAVRVLRGEVPVTTARVQGCPPCCSAPCP